MAKKMETALSLSVSLSLSLLSLSLSLCIYIYIGLYKGFMCYSLHTGKGILGLYKGVFYGLLRGILGVKKLRR